MKEEEEERKNKLAENTAGWIEKGAEGQIMDQPKQLDVSTLNETQIKYQVQDNNCDNFQPTEFDTESQK